MITIEMYAPKDKAPYYHMQPIVDFLLSSGNESCHSYLWGVNRTGYFCHLKQDINFDELKKYFKFPDSIILDEDDQLIDCLNTYTVIRGGMGK